MNTSLASFIARTLQRIVNIANGATTLNADHVRNDLDTFVKENLPSGSGFNAGTTLNIDSTAQRIVFDTSFHHMDEHGYYDGWTQHQVIVTPCLMFGFKIRVTGRNRNDIKDYIHDVFHNLLNNSQCDWSKRIADKS